MNNSPIGVFDSGMGGLSVWRVLRKALADESLVFLGDGHSPFQLELTGLTARVRGRRCGG